jgi:hypothetical protein
MRPTRQRLLAAFLAVLLVGSLVAASGPIGLLAPFTGEAWALADEANPDSVGNQLTRVATGPTTVESPHGEATVRYDERGVPHIEAENDEAMAYAVGYVQARDRLFQLDLQRRLMRGELAEAFVAASTGRWTLRRPQTPPGRPSKTRKPVPESRPTPMASTTIWTTDRCRWSSKSAAMNPTNGRHRIRFWSGNSSLGLSPGPSLT